MAKHFYSHIIDASSLFLELGGMELSQEERLELIDLANSNIHHAVLDTILSELSEEDKKIFLANLAKNDRSKIWGHLKTKIKNIEEKIKKAADALKDELHKDIRESKNTHD